MSRTDARLDELEVRLAYQDKTLGELNDVVTAQWKTIDALERKLARLTEEVEALDATGGPPVQKPPHY